MANKVSSSKSQKVSSKVGNKGKTTAKENKSTPRAKSGTKVAVSKTKASTTAKTTAKTVTAKSKTASAKLSRAKDTAPKVNGNESANKTKPMSKKRQTFLKKQEIRLHELRDALIDQMQGTTRDTLRQGDIGESAFGMHQADAGSDSYDRDFALSLLSQEQDALYEINEALERINRGTYGVCEISGEEIPDLRLEALPYTRFTVSCQEQLERNQNFRGSRRTVRSLFGLTEGDSDVDDSASDK